MGTQKCQHRGCTFRSDNPYSFDEHKKRHYKSGKLDASMNKIRTALGQFEEDKHPRDHGKFSSKPGAQGEKEEDSTKVKGMGDYDLKNKQFLDKADPGGELKKNMQGFMKNLPNKKDDKLDSPAGIKGLSDTDYDYSKPAGYAEKQENIRIKHSQKAWESALPHQKFNTLMLIDGMTEGVAKRLVNSPFEEFSRPFRNKVIGALAEGTARTKYELGDAGRDMPKPKITPGTSKERKNFRITHKQRMIEDAQNYPSKAVDANLKAVGKKPTNVVSSLHQNALKKMPEDARKIAMSAFQQVDTTDIDNKIKFLPEGEARQNAKHVIIGERAMARMPPKVRAMFDSAFGDADSDVKREEARKSLTPSERKSVNKFEKTKSKKSVSDDLAEGARKLQETNKKAKSIWDGYSDDQKRNHYSSLTGIKPKDVDIGGMEYSTLPRYVKKALQDQANDPSLGASPEEHAYFEKKKQSEGKTNGLSSDHIKAIKQDMKANPQFYEEIMGGLGGLDPSMSVDSKILGKIRKDLGGGTGAKYQKRNDEIDEMIIKALSGGKSAKMEASMNGLKIASMKLQLSGKKK